jgi:hypothetical protein
MARATAEIVAVVYFSVSFKFFIVPTIGCANITVRTSCTLIDRSMTVLREQFCTVSSAVVVGDSSQGFYSSSATGCTRVDGGSSSSAITRSRSRCHHKGGRGG